MGSATLTQRVDEMFASWDKPQSPGMSIGIIHNGEMIYGRGYGQANLEHPTPLSTKTVFYIASESKQFTAACIAILQRQGKLSLDDEIQKHLPEIRFYEAPITIRHLIHHTSGIREYLALGRLVGFDFENTVPDEQVLKLIAGQSGLNHRPGEKFEYCNSGYFLLGEIVKRASGLNLRRFAEENIFIPLGMKNTHFRDDHRQLIPNRAAGYYLNEHGFQTLVTNHTSMGDGGVWTTVDDMLLWDKNFFNNVIGGFGQGFIEELTTPGVLGSGASLAYAFGLDVGSYRGAKIIDHGGRFAGYSCAVLRFPEHRFTVICLANFASNSVKTMVRGIADIYLEDVLQVAESGIGSRESVESQELERGVARLSEESLGRFTGTYYCTDLDVSYRLEVVDAQLCLDLSRTCRKTLSPRGPTVFDCSHDFGVLDFSFDEHRQVSGFTLSVLGIRGVHFEKC
jgi:CubicO group peptidase (beta-lactamase class C family)